MHRPLSSVFWVLLYLGLVIGSLFVMQVGTAPTGRRFWTEFSVAIGFLGLAQILVQFALIARFKRLTQPYGIDAIMYYHRQIGTLAVLAVVAHPIILALEEPAIWRLFNPFGGSWGTRTGVWGALTLVALFLLSFFRRGLRINYETWRISHLVLAVIASTLAIVHVALAGPYVRDGGKLWFWIVFGGLALTTLAYARLLKPLLQWSSPYRILGVKREADRTFSLVVEPLGHEGMQFEPGQFAWLKLNHPFSIDEHPFSFSSSSECPQRLEFGIKMVGDFTSRLPKVDPSIKVYLDGPHGSFSIDRIPSAGYVFIAGGIGIVPIMSMIRTMADRYDGRPILLIYGARRPENFAYRAELDGMGQRANLQIVYVVEEAADGWEGEVGRVSRELLAKHLPKERIVRDYLICGPDGMIVSVEKALATLGVTNEHLHSERFDLV